jgi:hypothetical protein
MLLASEKYVSAVVWDKTRAFWYENEAMFFDTNTIVYGNCPKILST